MFGNHFSSLAVAILWHITHSQCQKIVQMCDSSIYCYGPILDLQARLRLFRSSKAYVDMPLSKSPEEILSEFKKRFSTILSDVYISKESLADFIGTYFEEPGMELLQHVPSDWTLRPQTFDVITDQTYRKWAYDLHHIWQRLSRRVNGSVARYPDRFSLIYVPHPFIIPGGRFREYYYWDSYWILRGLLTSEMYLSAKNMIRNFAYLIKKFGFVPNGGRVYYLGRSQPPLFIPMVSEYYQATADFDFVKSMLPIMEKEITFWLENRMIKYSIPNSRETANLFVYKTATNVPRPESYSEDISVASGLPIAARPDFYNQVASTAESGWDFSSRFLPNGSTDLRALRTTRILPVDLNAFICGNLKMLGDAYRLVGNYSMSGHYYNLYRTMQGHMMGLFYNHSLGAWFDIDIDTNLHNLEFYASNFVPLFTMCYLFEDDSGYQLLLRHFLSTRASKYPSGIPTSLQLTGQQWDFPNGWPNLQHMIIEGFERTGYEKLMKVAFDIAKNWLRNNYMIFQRTGYMYEKYDVTGQALAGGGGEYEVQVGFGWTNGIVLDLLRKYGQDIKYA